MVKKVPRRSTGVVVCGDACETCLSSPTHVACFLPSDHVCHGNYGSCDFPLFPWWPGSPGLSPGLVRSNWAEVTQHSLCLSPFCGVRRLKDSSLHVHTAVRLLQGAQSTITDHRDLNTNVFKHLLPLHSRWVRPGSKTLLRSKSPRLRDPATP